MSETPFDEIIAALDRLNSWVRSPERWNEHRPTQAVYRCKRLAIGHAHKIGCLRSVGFGSVLVACRSCSATGWWHPVYDMEDDDGYCEMCLKCSGVGRARLRFVETRIAGARWHTPVRQWPDGICAPPEPDSPRWYATFGGWEPNRPGYALEPWQVARDFGTLTRMWPDETRGVHIDLGETGSHEKCARCDNGEIRVVPLVLPGIIWHEHLCRECERRCWNDLVNDPRLPDGAAHPEIAAWRERAGRDTARPVFAGQEDE